ncbi:MAG: phosphoglucosamine mutase, partial [Clostridia bacterium]|nr:phosphoglucosamine mutase [Clostridia bacterium]
DLGFAFDGDADRVIAVDDCGKIVDGDGILYVIAKHLAEQNSLSGDTVVATVMTNSGVEIALQKLGIKLVRVSVGDHNVCAEMQKNGYTLGGEQSGHIILSDIGTGDGIYAALLLSNIVKISGKLSAIFEVSSFPQILKNVVVATKSIPFAALNNAECWRKHLDGSGRVLLRLSGTEPIIRIMVECIDSAFAAFIVRDIEYSLKKELDNEA